MHEDTNSLDRAHFMFTGIVAALIYRVTTCNSCVIWVFLDKYNFETEL